MPLRKTLLILGAVLCAALAPRFAEAQVDVEIQQNAQAIVDLINAPFAEGLGFFTSLGWNTPPEVFDLKDGPRVEVGAGLNALILDLPDLGSLAAAGVTVLPGDVGLVIPTFLPLPIPVATARVGLFNGLDVGGRFAYIPQFDLSSIGIGISADVTGFGFDVRFKVVDDPLLPTIAVGGSYDVMKGTLSVRTDINNFATNYSGGAVTIDGPAGYSLDWDTQSFGANVLVGKDLAGFYPFGSIGFQRNSGSITSTFNGDFDVTNGGTTNYVINAVRTATPVLFEPKFVLGIDVGEGFKWGLLFESNGVDIAGGTSFKGRF